MQQEEIANEDACITDQMTCSLSILEQKICENDGGIRFCNLICSGGIEGNLDDDLHQVCLILYSKNKLAQLIELKYIELQAGQCVLHADKLYFKIQIDGLALGMNNYFIRLGSRLANSDMDSFNDIDGLLQVSTPVVPPLAPLFLRVIESTPTSLKLQWEAPKCTGGNEIHSYQLEYRYKSSSIFQEAYSGPENISCVTGLQSGLEYEFRVRVATPMPGAFSSNPCLGTTLASTTAPSAPMHLHATVIDEPNLELAVTWKPSVHHESDSLEYTLEICPLVDDGHDIYEKAFQMVFNGDSCQTVVRKGVEAGVSYLLRVRSRSQTGYSPYSNTITVTTNGAPPAPPRDLLAKMKRFSYEVNVEWKPPLTLNGGNIRKYMVEYRSEYSDCFTTYYIGPNLSATLKSITPGQVYYIRAYAQNMYGWSGSSEVISIETKMWPPQIPTSPLSLVFENDECFLQFKDTVPNADSYCFFIRRSISDENRSTGDAESDLGIQKVVSAALALNRAESQSSNDSYVVDTLVECLYSDNCYYAATVKDVSKDKYLVEFSEYVEDGVHWVDKSKLRERLQTGTRCVATCYHESGETTKEVGIVTAVMASTYWVVFQNAELPPQETYPNDVFTYNSPPRDDSPWISIGQITEGTTFRVPLDLLQKGVAYDAYYVASNEAGNSSQSPILENFFVGMKRPTQLGAPKILEIQGRQVTVDLGYPRNLYGGTLQHWVAQLATAEPNTGQDIPESVTIVDEFTDLQVVHQPIATLTMPHILSTFALRASAVSSVGKSRWSAPVGLSTADGIPCCAIDNIYGEFGKGLTLEVLWQVPTCLANSDIQIRVDVHFESSTTKSSSNQNFSWKSFEWILGSDGHYELTHPATTRRVWIRLQTRNEFGPGPVSQDILVDRPQLVPDAIPGRISWSDCGKTWVRVSWPKCVDDGGDTIIGYETEIVRLNQSHDELVDPVLRANIESPEYEPEGRGEVHFIPGKSCTTKCKGLESDSNYIIRVCPVNGIGNGLWSPWKLVSTTSHAMVDGPTSLTIRSEPPNLVCRWKCADSSLQVELQLSVTTDISQGEFRTVFHGYDTKWTETRVVAGATYRGRVRVHGNGSMSEFTPVVVLKTKPSVERSVPSTPGSTRSRKKAVLKKSSKEGSSKHLVSASVALKRRRLRWFRKYPTLIPLVLVVLLAVGTMIYYLLFLDM